MKKFTIKVGTFNMSVRFIITKNKSKASKYINKQFVLPAKGDDYKIVPSQLDNVYGRIFMTQKYYPIIWMPTKPKNIREIGTLVHELLHSVFHTTDYYGVEYSKKGEELYTHMLTHLLIQALKKMKLKIK